MDMSHYPASTCARCPSYSLLFRIRQRLQHVLLRKYPKLDISANISQMVRQDPYFTFRPKDLFRASYDCVNKIAIPAGFIRMCWQHHLLRMHWSQTPTAASRIVGTPIPMPTPSAILSLVGESLLLPPLVVFVFAGAALPSLDTLEGPLREAVLLGTGAALEEPPTPELQPPAAMISSALNADCVPEVLHANIITSAVVSSSVQLQLP